MPGTTYTPAELASLSSQHGGLVGSKVLSTAPVKNPLTGLSRPNPNPDIRYDFGDHTYMTAHFDGTQGDAGAWVVTDPGTVNKPLGARAASPKTFTDPETGQTYQLDPGMNTWAPAVGLPAGGPTPADVSAAARAAAQAAADANAKAHQAELDKAQQDANARAQARQDSLDQAQQALNTRAEIAQAARDKQAALQNQIAQGSLDNATATRQFSEWYQTNVTAKLAQTNTQNTMDQQAFAAQDQTQAAGLAAGQDAVKNAQLGTVNAVGPNFGANFAAALNGVANSNPSQVHFGPSDFTYQQPDYTGIAARAAAQAVAHLSPFAAALAGRSAPAIPAYQPPAQPSVLQAAAQTAIAQAPAAPAPAPAPSPAPALPAYMPQSGRN